MSVAHLEQYVARRKQARPWALGDMSRSSERSAFAAPHDTSNSETEAANIAYSLFYGRHLGIDVMAIVLAA